MLALYLAMIDSPSDREKFSAIYQEYRELMFRAAMAVLHNEALAEEAVQEGFLKIAKNISRFSEPICSKSASFIVIIVRNTAIDILRKENLGASLPYDEDIATPDSLKMPDVGEVLYGDGETVFEAISSMDKIYSDALKLKYIYGFKNSEIAELLGISEKNAQMRVYRAKLILKKKLEEAGYEIK